MSEFTRHDRHPHRRPLRRPLRRGFTLVELMIVISIIALLLALLVPAVSSAFGQANVARVKTEIGAFENAIADFKVQYGVEPPSSITLCETGDPADWTADAKSKIRRIFGPKFDFSQKYDFDGDGATTTTDLSLNGAQCLIFFLAGPVRNGTTEGFSKNPSKPFKTAGSTEEERIRFFDVESDRLVIVQEMGNDTVFATYTAPSEQGAYLYVHHDDYRDAAGTGALKNVPGFTPYKLPSGGFHQPRSYQIICAGSDNEFGAGGVYDPEDSDTLINAQEPDRDNITNFSKGRLAN